MDATNELLDKCKQMRSIPTDMALAQVLGVGRATVSSYRHGRTYPDPVVCARISEITGEPLSRVLGIVGEARALSADEKRVWRRLATAAAIGVAFLIPMQSPTTLTGGESMHYAKWLVRAITQRVRDWLAARSNDAPALLVAR